MTEVTAADCDVRGAGPEIHKLAASPSRRARRGLRGPGAAWAVLACSSLAASSCRHPAPDASPEGVVRLFLDDMDFAGEDPNSIRRVYELLGPASRTNLQERARRASELQGRHVQPWDMVAAGLFGLAFRPKAMHATVVGDRANVEVLGEDARAEHATVFCVHEASGWRVEPGFPDP